MREFILVISMWGSDGATDHYIGQMALQQPLIMITFRQQENLF